MEIAKEYGIRKIVPLAVSAPFHCSLMKAAAETMAKAFAEETFCKPAVPLVSNVTAEAEIDPNALKLLLVQQVTERVRWRECILKLKSLGITTLVEVGAGKVLTGLAKRIDPEIGAFSLNRPEDIDLFIQQF